MGKEKTKEELRLQRATAERIKSEREHAGMTQDEMAEKAGLTVENLKKIENADNAMSMNSLRGVQKALDVSFDYLLLGLVAPIDDLWQKMNACSRSDCVELLIRLLRKLLREDFSQEEEVRQLAADIHRQVPFKETYEDDNGYQTADGESAL